MDTLTTVSLISSSLVVVLVLSFVGYRYYQLQKLLSLLIPSNKWKFEDGYFVFEIKGDELHSEFISATGRGSGPMKFETDMFSATITTLFPNGEKQGMFEYEDDNNIIITGYNLSGEVIKRITLARMRV